MTSSGLQSVIHYSVVEMSKVGRGGALSRFLVSRWAHLTLWREMSPAHWYLPCPHPIPLVFWNFGLPSFAVFCLSSPLFVPFPVCRLSFGWVCSVICPARSVGWLARPFLSPSLTGSSGVPSQVTAACSLAGSPRPPPVWGLSFQRDRPARPAVVHCRP